MSGLTTDSVEKVETEQQLKPLPDGKKFHVFISFSESDRAWVNAIIQELQDKYKLKCFEHSADFIAGKKIAENIEYAMTHSVKTLIILTKEYKESYWCQYEVEFGILNLLAEMKENVLIPVLKEHCTIPGYLRPFTYIDATGDIDVYLPKIALAIESEGAPYNHDIALNKVKDAVNRNRNLDLLYEVTSQTHCNGQPFPSKYVPETLSIEPMKFTNELFTMVMKELTSTQIVLGRHCRSPWWATICLWFTLVTLLTFSGLLFLIEGIKAGETLNEPLVFDHYRLSDNSYVDGINSLKLGVIILTFEFAVLVIWPLFCCLSNIVGRRQIDRKLRKCNEKLLPYKVLVAYRNNRISAKFTICFLFYDMTPCVNHVASEMHNRNIQKQNSSGVTSMTIANDDTEHLIGQEEENVMDDLQEKATDELLDISSQYLKEYMDEKLQQANANYEGRHASKAKCLCQFMESVKNFKTNDVLIV